MLAFLSGQKLASLYCIGPADTCRADAFPHACGFTCMPMHLPTHACLHTRKPHCVVVGGPVSLAAVIEAHNCGGWSGSCPGLLVGPSRDNAIAAAHAVGLALLPLSHPCCRPHHNWRLPSPDAVATHWRTWHCCPFLVYARGSVAYPALCHGDLAFGGPAGVAFVALPALHWCPRPQQAGVIASVALSLSPALHQRCPPCRAGIFTLIVLAL